MSQVKRLGTSKQKWTDDEEKALRAGVDKYGVGKWRLIQKDEAFGPQLVTRSNVDLKDKWRNLNMDAFGSRGDKRGSRTKHRAKQRHKAAATAAATLAPSAAQAAMATVLSAGPPEREIIARQRKRKRRPERATDGTTYLPLRDSSGALRALQEAALGPDSAEALPRRRRRRKPAALRDDDDEDEEPEEEPLQEDDEDGLNNRSGPTPDDMVVAAIISLQDPVGSHPDDIMHWIQDHYAVSAYVKRQIRSALQRMVDAGRLEAVPNHASLFRLGGVIRQLSQEAGIEWPRIKPGTGLLDPRAGGQSAVEQAEAAAQAVAEAEEAAALATRLMDVANRYEEEAQLAGVL
ncbi:hypothetical protein CVIRNUC_001769 [Coccomyxa viridis]|uniref:MYB transcription factor n=1 Tax=Coccomyxa viridis TaxID=1274662 RepID=A0AAV1HV03_9CHLO|nr:hypothetical protein CVIRNUC_001769 [Coccomyxa viridis]